MFIKFISYVPAIFGLLTIGFFVFLNNVRAVKNIVFSLLTVFMALWLVSLFIGDTATSSTVALWSIRFGIFFAAIMVYLFFLFSLVFPFNSRFKLFQQILMSIPLLILCISSFSNLQVKTVTIQGFGAQLEEIGSLYAYSDIVAALYLLAAAGVLINKYRKSDKAQKNQIKFVLYGVIIALVINIFTGSVLTLLKIDTNLIALGGISIFVFALFVSYAIVWQGFLDIRSVVARSVAYVLSLGSIASVTALIIYSSSGRLESVGATEAQLRLFYVAIAVVLAIFYQPVKSFFDRLTNKYFYQDAYEPQDLLNDLNTSLVSSIDMASIMRNTSLLLEHYLKPGYAGFYIFKTAKTGSKSFITKDQSNLAIEDINKLCDKSDNKTLGLSDTSNLPQDIQKLVSDKNMGMIAKLVSAEHKGEIIGAIILGQKKSGSMYGRQDFQVMEIIADELVIATQNALRFEEIQQFNITLQAKVDKATGELRKANTKLIAMDQTKDDFISMASHQLRTPLTSVKGYVSMVLEGDVGKVTKEQRKLLDQAFLSSQRMVYLIADLLNVSRLKTGKFIIEPKPTNLADVVGAELEQLKETAAARQLELKYEKPKKFPELQLDDTKIRQVIMNFVDNAIYYTPANGHIEVALADKGKSIEFTVTDDGIGVPKAEQHQLFNKFYRAGNARKARPDGTGLGLFMAKKVVIAQGGSIIFKTEEGKGSTFGFSFEKSKLKAGTHSVNFEDKDDKTQEL